MQAPGVAAGFVSAYGLWTVLTKDSAQKLPKTITNPAWIQATESECQLLASAPATEFVRSPRVLPAQPCTAQPAAYMQ